MKRIELIFSAVLLPVDYTMIVLAGLSAHALRFGSAVTEIRPVFDELSLRVFFPALLIGALGWLGIFALSGLYSVRGTRKLLDEFTSIFLACSTSITAVIILFFFQRELFSSRFILVIAWILAIVYVTIGRLIVRSVQRSMLSRNRGSYKMIVVGNDSTTAHLLETFKQSPILGYNIVGMYAQVDDRMITDLESKMRNNHEVAVDQRGVDIILQADSDLPKEQTQRLIDFCNDHHVTFKYAADVFETQSTNVSVDTLAGIPIIELRRTKLDGWGRILKRLFDILCALLGLILTSPIFIITALLIRADSPGSTLVRLRRVGEGGRHFDVLKFRSMVENAHAMKAQLEQFNERSGPLFKMKNDPRVTRIGRFLRRSSIDELPQLINVLKGEMSLVGPRPHEPEEVARYERRHRKLLTIRPGITGLAQVSGRSDLHFDDEARLDIFYIENWSFRLDFSILFRTPVVVLRMKSAA